MFRRRDRRDEGRAAETGEDLDMDALEAEDDEAGEEDLEPGEDEPEDMTADLESQAADYLADNDAWMYGPNAEEVLEILDRLEDLTPAEAGPVAQAWADIPKADREHARKAIRKIVETDEEMARHYQLAREAVGTWLAVKSGFPEFVASGPDWPRIAAQTSEAALDAATAVVLDERLEEADYQALSSPWNDAIAEIQVEEDIARIEGVDEDEEETEDEAGEEDEEGEGEFGPNTDSVTDFLNRLWLLTPEQISRLVSAWRNLPKDELKDAHEALADLVADDDDYRTQVRAAQARLAPWLNATRFEETAGLIGQAGQGESRKMAGPALADAMAALVVGDLMEPQQAELLYRPWYSLIGAPPLAEPAPIEGEEDEEEDDDEQEPTDDDAGDA
jgi:hypothetical protein